MFYLLKRQINTVFEFRADTEVLKHMPNTTTEYMECILNLYKRQAAHRSFPLTAAFCSTDKNSLLKRFQYIAAKNSKYKESLTLALVICLCLFLVSFSVVFEAEYPSTIPGVYSTDELQKNSFILKTKENKYYLYINKEFGGEININTEDFKQIPIYETAEVLP